MKHEGTREEAFYASTPPLEAKNILFQTYASNPTRPAYLRDCHLYTCARPISTVSRSAICFLTSPRELGLPPNLVGRQVRCVYGTRGAGGIWKDCCRDCLEDKGFSSGGSSPCCPFHKERDLACVVHGDGFTCLGSDANLDWYEAQMALSFELKIRGRLRVGCKGPMRSEPSIELCGSTTKDCTTRPIQGT